MRYSGMTNRKGKIIGKRNKYGLFGRKVYYIDVRFDQKYNYHGHDQFEYPVDSDLFEDVIIGAFVRGEFEQIPDGLRPLFLY